MKLRPVREFATPTRPLALAADIMDGARFAGRLIWSDHENDSGARTTCWGLALPNPPHNNWRNFIALPEANDRDDVDLAFTIALSRWHHELATEVGR